MRESDRDRRKTALLASLLLATCAGAAPAQDLAVVIGLGRGDSDGNGRVELADAVRIIGFLFRGGPVLDCPDRADANDDGTVNLSDPVRILLHLFGGQPLPAPELADLSADRLPCLSGRPPCPPILAVETLGAVENEFISQPSGAAASRRDAGLLWLVNDYDASEDPRIFAVGRHGEPRGELLLCLGSTACFEFHADCSGESFERIH